MKKFFTLILALLIGGFVFAERPPMYAGGNLGYETFAYEDWFRTHTFGIEPHFGFRPIPNHREMGFEAAVKHAFKRSRKFEGANLDSSCTSFLTRFVYDFKPLSSMEKLNFFVEGGLGLGCINYKYYSGDSDGGSNYSYSYSFTWEGKDTFLVMPVGGGARYQILEHLEAVAQAELGLGKLMSFDIMAGVNYEF